MYRIITIKTFCLLVFTALLLSGAAHAQGVLYMVADEGDDALWTVNTTTAAVTKIGSVGAQNGDAEGLAPSPSPNSFLYAVSNDDLLDRINTDGSGFTNVGASMDDCDRGLAYNSATGILYGSDNNSFCSINQSTSVTTSLPNPPGDDTEGLAADPVNNHVYGIDNDQNLVRFDVGANSWSVIGPTVNISDGNDIGLAYDPGAATLYAVDNDGILYSVNRSTGLATRIGDTGVGTGLDVGLAFVPQGSAAASRATFTVTKDFTDDNPGEVEVSISCNTGLILDQSKLITEDRGVTFVVTDFDNGEMNCEITEKDLNGYATEYFDGSSSSSTSCEFLAISHGGTFTCEITNTPVPVTVSVSKEWIFTNTEGNEISDEFEITLVCNAVIEGGHDIGNDQYRANYHNSGDATANFIVHPTFGGNTCAADETIYDSSAIKSTDNCSNLSINIGQGASCTITNTVFFEGIPTLNQYSMALLALLMLGVGFVSFRRLV